MSNHTPAPWKVGTSNGGRIWADDGRILIAETQLSKINTMLERKANATLIATAPELLEILETLVSTFDPEFQSMYGFARAKINKAKELIAIAKGES